MRKSLCLEAGTPRNELALVGRTTRPRSPFVPSSAPVPRACSCTPDSARARPAAACRAAGSNGTALAGACKPVAVPQSTLLNSVPSLPTRTIPRPVPARTRDVCAHTQTLRRARGTVGNRTRTCSTPAVATPRSFYRASSVHLAELSASSVPARCQNVKLFGEVCIRAAGRDAYSTLPLVELPTARGARFAGVYFRQHGRPRIGSGTPVTSTNSGDCGTLRRIITEVAARHQQASPSASWPPRRPAAIFSKRRRLQDECRGPRLRGRIAWLGSV